MRVRTALVLLALLLAAALSLPAQKAVSDNLIFDQVRIRLVADVDVKGNNLRIGVSGGVVTLQGNVESEKALKKAEKLTKRVKGVKSVVNQLRIVKP